MATANWGDAGWGRPGAAASQAIDAGEAGFEVVPQAAQEQRAALAPMTYVVVFTAPNA